MTWDGGRMKANVSTSASNGEPIFILGISQRSGTNYLADLLCLHPDCGLPAPIWEDFFLYYAAPLVEYAGAIHAEWYRWIADENSEGLIYRRIGDGLLEILRSRMQRKRIVTKTPSVRNLQYFFKFFPSAHLLLLVRDGRSVVESKLKMSGGNFEWFVRRWAEAADIILRFDRAMKGSGVRYLIVRYEDLWTDVHSELRRIFAFLDLDPRVYDFSAAMTLPVKGSSVFGRGEGVHWLPVEKDSTFDPTARWSHWSRSMHRRYNWLAGRQSVALGYEQKGHGENYPLWAAWNAAYDAWWMVREFSKCVRSWILARLRPTSEKASRTREWREQRSAQM